MTCGSYVSIFDLPAVVAPYRILHKAQGYAQDGGWQRVSLRTGVQIKEGSQLMLLSGQVAVVTGGGRGNGEAIALGLAEEGAAVAVIDLDEAQAVEVAERVVTLGSRAIAVVADIAVRTDCQRVADVVRRELGTTSILVNNAGITRRSRLGDADFLESFDQQHQVNLQGPLNMIDALLPSLRESRGTIVNVASTVAFRSSRSTVGYAVSKAGLVHLTRVLAAELGPAGIRVNAIAPGLILTRMTEEIGTDKAAMARILERTPLGRVGYPQDLVGPVVFLTSTMSAFVTGTTLPVDGGTLTM
jgi:NAD(P)-dependent dehydrogenase (short-subunit alcohol dehydrogenase family)